MAMLIENWFMKKKIIKIALLSLVVILAVVALIMLWGGSSDKTEKSAKVKKPKYSNKVYFAGNYIDALPEKPLALIRVRVDKMLEKSEALSNDDLRMMYSAFGVVLPDKVRKNADALLNNPSSAGIDISKPLYAGVYQNASGDNVDIVLAASISDKQRLTEVLESILSEFDYDIVEQKDGLCYVVDNSGTRVVNAVFDNNTLLCSNADVMNYVSAGGSTLSKNEQYKALSESTDDIAMVSDIDNVLSFGSDSLQHNGASKIFADACVEANLDFVTGGAEGVVEVKLQPKYQVLTNVLKGATGKYMKYMPDNAVAIFNFNADVNVLYDMLPVLFDGIVDKSMIDQYLTDKSFLNTLSTEYTIAALPSAFKKSGGDISNCIIAIDDPDKKVLHMLTNANLQKIDTDLYTYRYKVENKPYTATLGHMEGTLFLIPDARNIDLLPDGSAKRSTWFNGLEGKEVCINAAALDGNSEAFVPEFLELLDLMQVETVTLDFDNMSHIDMRLDVADKTRNMMKLISDTFFIQIKDMIPQNIF